MELAAGVGDEPREVTHSLEVSHSHGVPLEDHRPVVALATKDEVCGRLLVRSVLSGDVRDLNPLEDGARRLELQVCLVLAAAGP